MSDIYSAGDCAVCLDTGALLILARADGRIFLYCPMCGGAYTNIGDAGAFENVQSIDKLAPTGFHVATETEIRKQGWWGLATSKFAEGHWVIP